MARCSAAPSSPGCESTEEKTGLRDRAPVPLCISRQGRPIDGPSTYRTARRSGWAASALSCRRNGRTRARSAAMSFRDQPVDERRSPASYSRNSPTTFGTKVWGGTRPSGKSPRPSKPNLGVLSPRRDSRCASIRMASAVTLGSRARQANMASHSSPLAITNMRAILIRSKHSGLQVLHRCDGLSAFLMRLRVDRNIGYMNVADVPTGLLA
jgi:hypothetical protein